MILFCQQNHGNGGQIMMGFEIVQNFKTVTLMVVGFDEDQFWPLNWP